MIVYRNKLQLQQISSDHNERYNSRLTNRGGFAIQGNRNGVGMLLLLLLADFLSNLSKVILGPFATDTRPLKEVVASGSQDICPLLMLSGALIA